MATTTTRPGTAATARIAGFVATLRTNGFVIGQRETEDALSLAETVGVMERQPLRWGWRSLLAPAPKIGCGLTICSTAIGCRPISRE